MTSTAIAASTSPARVRWGIVSAGHIAGRFLLDLLIDPATRQASDIKHEVYAVASRTKQKASDFIAEKYKEAGATGAEHVVPYGSYEELFADKNVDCVYIGTPHSHHYQNVHAALSAGKNVLCEKAFTANAKQAQALVDLARSNNLFMMEAVWTRFQPYSYKLQEIISSGVIGEVRAAQAELNVNFEPIAKKNPGHRLVNPDLCGGALLDLGPYPWTQLALALMPASKASLDPCPMPKVVSTMLKTSSGVDASTIAVIEYPQPDGRVVHGTLTTSQVAQSAPNRVLVVQGSRGFIETAWPTYRPESMRYVAWANEEDYGKGAEPIKSETFSFTDRPGDVWGFAWEADEVARCLRDGKKESDRMPLRETVLMMQVFDEIRKQGRFEYPDHVERLDL